MSEVLANDFEKRKTAYCAEFAVSHLSSFRPHFKVGETLGKKPEVWRNVSEHCLVAGIFADILAEKLSLSSDDRENVVRAALLHDWYKKFESQAQIKARNEGELTLDVLNQIKQDDSRALSEMGVSETVIGLTGANVPPSTEGPEALPGKIFWYVDAMLSNTNPVPIRERFNDLERGWDGTKEDSSRAQRNIAFSNIYREKYDGKSLYEVQRTLGDRISQEFSEAIGFEGRPSDLPIYLKEKFVERINSR